MHTAEQFWLGIIRREERTPKPHLNVLLLHGALAVHEGWRRIGLKLSSLLLPFVYTDVRQSSNLARRDNRLDL